MFLDLHFLIHFSFLNNLAKLAEEKAFSIFKLAQVQVFLIFHNQ